MDIEPAWPPKSPHAALLSSPSGKRKFLQYERNKENSRSPAKSWSVEGHQPTIGVDDEDDDEETLQLKLAAIEAKLKLKRLQQNKAKPEAGSTEDQEFRPSKPSSPVSGARRNLFNIQKDCIRDSGPECEVHVPPSPPKRDGHNGLQRSPGRKLLGIDKGVTSAEVSLRRARTVHGGSSKFSSRTDFNLHMTTSRTSAYGSAQSRTLGQAENFAPVKSFSERMAEIREGDKQRQHQRDAIVRKRGSALRLAQEEIESYRRAAEEVSKQEIPTATSIRNNDSGFRREEILESRRQAESRNRILKKTRTLPDLRRPSPSRKPASMVEPGEEHPPQNRAGPDHALYEPLSHLNLSSRILPHSFLTRTLPKDTFSYFRVADLLKQVTSPAYELPDSVTEFAVFGIIASKSSPLDHKITQGENNSKATTDWERKWEDGSQNQKKFMVFQLTDLRWSIDLYLFGTAVPRYHRLSPGTVVAILNPGIMPPKKGREDTGAFSLTLHSADDTVLEIGSSRDLGFCNAIKKDGKECGTWVNGSKTEICEFHLNLQISKAQASRMGVNAGSNGFGSASRNKPNSFANGTSRHYNGQEKDQKDGHRYDRWTGSHFYIASSTGGSGFQGAGAPLYKSEHGTAWLLDQADNDDPFIAEGQLSRDKDARLRKRLANQARERDIAKKLLDMTAVGAGAEYLRHRSSDKRGPAQKESSDALHLTNESTVSAVKRDILNFKSTPAGRGKRLAEDVKLSPVKKTRFVTEKGVKEAGRESLGTKTRTPDEANDDDDLDIV